MIYNSPTGSLYCTVSEGAVTLVSWQPPPQPLTQEAGTLLERELARQLDDYFAGQRTVFDLPVRLAGTAFRQRVWQALTDIPYGQTISYGTLARLVGSSPRAVGGANHHNPVSILVPCHRVIGADGRPVGYGGGLEVKAYLLALERRCVAKQADKSEKSAESTRVTI